MKDFFKKIWEAIKGFFTKVFSAIVTWLQELPAGHYVYFIIGFYLTAILAIVFPGAVEWPFVPVAALFIIIAFIKTFCGKPVYWWHYVAAVLGALSVQVLCWLA